MQTFVLNRIRDISGVSGTGIVAEGIVFSNGRVVLCWVGETPSINIYNDLASVNIVHGHRGATQIEFTP